MIQSGTDTRTRLIASAEELFSEKWYSIVSIADICRNAGLSNGVYYTYFRSKEAIFRTIVESFLDDIQERLAAVPAPAEPTPAAMRAAFARLVEAIFTLEHDERARMSIFREAQYRSPEFESRMRHAISERLEAILGRACTTAEEIFVVAGVRFAAYRSAFNGLAIDTGSLIDIVCGGLFDHPFPDGTKTIFDISATPNPLRLMESSRDRLMRAGRSLFGARGYHDVNIHDITDQAGLSVGSFYNYFPAKEDLYREVIAAVNHDLRSFIGRNLDRTLPRVAQEIQGTWLFVFYLTIERTAYNLVREAEFVLPAAVKAYYDAFERGYEPGLQGIRIPDHKTVAAFLMGVAHYFGMEVLFDEELSNAQRTLTELGELMVHGIDGGRCGEESP